MDAKAFDYRKGWKNSSGNNEFDKKNDYVDFGTKRVNPDRYISQDFMDNEWENVWTKTWLMACSSSDIKNLGDYFNFNIGKESIIVMRSSENTTR